MLWILELLSMAANLVMACFTGSALIMGVVFFLIGFQGARLSTLAKGKQTRTDVFKICSTLGIVFVIFLISFESLRMTGKLTFSSGMTPETARRLGMRLVVLGLVQAAWLFISLKWLLPLVFDPIDLSPKRKMVVVSSTVLNLLPGLLVVQDIGV
ncbi:hypothetical protein [Paenibacillus sp. AR247]|uniref:hypothetical protein n=1 Tax=Paenibacillus sp. AR247 TaxID=1631599 RepID=UPI000CF9FA71|nr:hypothetical protein [Paenibacillus sp. AR247]PQP89905.1 hypothetical protein CPT76_18335 [Paenibacillus sp. AR247]